MINAKIITSKKGIAAFATVSLLTFEILLATKRFTPTGGVINPMARAVTIMTPKCIGSIPMRVAKGSKTGVMMTIAASASIKSPTRSRRASIERIIIALLSVKLRTLAAAVSGICSNVIKLPKIVAMAIKIIIIEEVKAASMVELQKRVQVNSL